MAAALLLWILVAAAVAPGGGRPVDAGAAQRQPVNSRCPVGRPGAWWPAMQQYVKGFELFQPGVSEALAASDAQRYRQLVTRFAFNMADFCLDYVDALQLPEGINATRPHGLRLDCRDPAYADILSGEPRQKNATIVWASHFSYEVPLLLFRLFTYHDLVDHFVVLEGTHFQHGGMVKPLLFERIKHHLVPFLDKVEHMVLSGIPHRHVGHDKKADDWTNERHERSAAHRAILRRFDGILQDDDIILYGDLDEMADEAFLLHLKQCQLKPGLSQPVNSNLLFWMTDYRHAFRSDWPPSSAYPYSLMFPQAWTLAEARKAPGLRTWQATAQPFPRVVGGWHFNQPSFMPGTYLKYIGVSEGSRKLFEGELHKDAAAWQRAFQEVQVVPSWRSRIPHPSCLMRSDAYNHSVLRLPWLMANNPEAFRDFIPCTPAFYDAAGPGECNT